MLNIHVQSQKGLSLDEFIENYGQKEYSGEAVFKANSLLKITEDYG